MSYHDIEDWAEENIPPDMYDNFQDWIDDIEKNFASHGHFFPKAMVDDLAELWKARMGELSDNEISKERRYASDKTEAYSQQYFEHRLAVAQKRQQRRIELARKQTRRKTSKHRMTKRQRRKSRSKGKKK